MPRVIDKMRMSFIAAVDNPAQEPALAAILKRAPDKVAKAFRLLTSVNGHAHLIHDDAEQGGETSWDVADGAESGHSHPYVRNTDGSYTVGDADGHTHEVLMLKMSEEILQKAGGWLGDMLSRASNKAAGATGGGRPTGEKNMPTGTKTAEPKDMAATVDKLEKDLAKSTALAEHNDKLAKLNDAEKAHMGALPESARPAFLALDGDARKAELAKVADADPVVYKTSDGLEIRKSAGDITIALAKKADAAEKKADAEIAKREQMELEKRATSPDMEHYGTKPNVTAAILKAVDGIDDETTRKAALDSLKAASSTNAAAFKTAGYRGKTDEDSDDPTVKLDKLAKAHADKNGTSVAKGMSDVLKTDEGKALYSQISEENPTH